MGKKICCILIMLISCIALMGCKESDDELIWKQHQEREDWLTSQEQSYTKTYAIANRNAVPINLPNYSKERLEIYDKHGKSQMAFGIEDKTVEHNWYTLVESETGAFQIDYLAIPTVRNFSPIEWDGVVYDSATDYEKTININLSPYENFNFARLNGEIHSHTVISVQDGRQTGSMGRGTVVVNATEFETTKIADVQTISSKTKIYVISYLYVKIEDTQVSFMEYKIPIYSYNTSSSDVLDMLYEYGEVIPNAL